MVKTENHFTETNKEKENTTQFIQRRIIEKIQDMSKGSGLPTLTCVQCDEPMLIITNSKQSFLFECSFCNQKALLEL